VLRGFIARSKVAMPPSATLMEIAGTLLAVRPDAQPEVRWPGGVMRRRAGRLEVEVSSKLSAAAHFQNTLKSWRWAKERELIINAAGDRLTLLEDPAGPIDLDRLPGTLELRPRRGGESLRPAAQARTQALKKLLQAARISPAERARLPLLFSGSGPQDSLIAAGDRWIDASIAATVKSRRRARLCWEKRDRSI
jgi:tRNA(Ile)-lysidine synthase